MEVIVPMLVVNHVIVAFRRPLLTSLLGVVNMNGIRNVANV